MQKHPDADAFVREYLTRPTDATLRLVFADWLEETGVPHNAAWAYFIRLRDEAEHYEPDSSERRELLRQADEYTPKIRAQLTIAADLFVGYPKSLLQLLPAPNITVRLANYTVPRRVLEFMPESMARENLILPLDEQQRTLLVATPHPHNYDIPQKLSFVLNREVIQVASDQDDVLVAIDHEYGQTETESVVCISYESPLVGLEGDPISDNLFSVFHTAFSSGATNFTMELDTDGCVVLYYLDEAILRREHYGSEVHGRLLEHLLSQESEREYTRAGCACIDLNVPLLSGRPFPTTLERRLNTGANLWFRLRFRW